MYSPVVLKKKRFRHVLLEACYGGTCLGNAVSAFSVHVLSSFLENLYFGVLVTEFPS